MRATSWIGEISLMTFSVMKLNCWLWVFLQIHTALDVLGVKSGGTSAKLGEKGCCFINQSSILKNEVRKVQDLAANIQKTTGSCLWSWSSAIYYWAPINFPIWGPLITIMFLLLIEPSVFKTFSRFLKFRMWPSPPKNFSFSWHPWHQLLYVYSLSFWQPYQPVSWCFSSAAIRLREPLLF